MTERTGLTLEELEAETGEELPARELMTCVIVDVIAAGGVYTAGACARVVGWFGGKVTASATAKRKLGRVATT